MFSRIDLPVWCTGSHKATIILANPAKDTTFGDEHGIKDKKKGSMSTLLGRVDESKEDWPQYVERVNHFFAVNGIDNATRQKSALLAAATYSLLQNLVSPDKAGERTYDQLVAILRDHFKPTRRRLFNVPGFSRVRKPGETVATFVSELRSLAEFCNFNNTLDDMLRDRIVCGINNTKIQQKLLAEKTLTLAKAIELAQGMETAAKNAKELAQQDTASALAGSEGVH